MTKNKNYIIGMQFNAIGGQNTELKDIVVKAADGAVGDGDTLLWVWDVSKNSYTAKFKYWADPYADDTQTVKIGKPGWGNELQVYTNFTFKVGDSIWLKPGVGGVTAAKKPIITIAGEVFNPGTDAQFYAWELTKNKNYMVSNPFPGDLDIANVVMYAKNDGAVGDGDSLLWIWDVNKSSYTTKFKYWANPYTDASQAATLGQPGWGDEMQVVTNLTISAGQGFWIKPGIGGVTSAKKPMVRFKNPFYTAK